MHLHETEADTCRRYVVPKLQTAGWESGMASIAEQVTFTDGRILVAGERARRARKKRLDYLLRLARDFAAAVVEAKASFKHPSDGLQQAKEYAEILGLKFAYSTNGHGIVEFDYFTGRETSVEQFPTPDELRDRLVAGVGGLDARAADIWTSPGYHLAGRPLRYYQEFAVRMVVQRILSGHRRNLLVMATGTGKTETAFQICWKLWHARWNASGAVRGPRILFLADRNILVDDPKDKTFAPFGDARHKLGSGTLLRGREMYFATYQSIAEDERRDGLYREFEPDFFDLIVVDECHRGSAREDSAWRDILEHFAPAYQLGLTATPVREDARDTYAYFGEPLYTYSLRQGIEDGFLAPYRVHRVVTTWDAAGWRPTQGELDRFGQLIPDGEYHTADFERVVSLRARTEAVAKHLTEFMRRTDRLAKTIVFCVDQEHASELRQALVNFNSDLVQQYPDYVVRVTADEGEVGRAHLGNFQDVEKPSPVILTTSQLLTTGVDAPTCKNVVIVRVIGSMTEFKQIIGRGTRVRDDLGKFYFNIIDYTGSATRLFADPAFDGDPAAVIEQRVDSDGSTVDEVSVETSPDDEDEGERPGSGAPDGDGSSTRAKKFYVDGGQIQVEAHLVYELDPQGRQLRVVSFTDYTAERVRTLWPTIEDARKDWANEKTRTALVESLESEGVSLEQLAEVTGRPDADPLDLLCHLAFNAPVRSRGERAEAFRRAKPEFLDRFGPEARQILNDLLDKYAEHGSAELALPKALKVPPLTRHGTVLEIAAKFGGAERLRDAVAELQSLLYVA